MIAFNVLAESWAFARLLQFFFYLQRLRSGDGEREASMTRQMPYEPLPASVSLGILLLGLEDRFKPTNSNTQKNEA